MKNAEYWIKRFGLIKHIEGGYYIETHRSEDKIEGDCLPERFIGKYSISTSIYFLLKSGECSRFHRLKSEEIWHFYTGCPLIIYILDSDGKLQIKTIGSDIENDESFQALVPSNCWIAAEPFEEESYSLIGCTVAPGFEYKDFELADAFELLKNYPQHQEIINKFT